MAPPPSLPFLHLTIFTFFFLLHHHHHLLLTQATLTQTPDLQPLLSFKTASDTGNKLTTWTSTTHPCTAWSGISCLNNRVSRLVLQDLNLSGSILPLTSLTQLRLLSLKRNRFIGPIPSLSNLTSLKLLYLSHNSFSGHFPSSITSLSRLYRLDLSYNNFSGNFPVTLNNLTHLLTFKIDSNQMSGHIPDIKLRNLQDFNVSGNRFSGRIPESLSGFNRSAFARNHDLCGVPLQKCKDIFGIVSSPLNPRNITSVPITVPSSPSSKPLPSNPIRKHGAPKMSPVVLITIIVGDVLILAVVSLILYCYFWRNYSSSTEGKTMSNSNSKNLEKNGYCSRYGKGGMVFFEGGKKFEVEELLRASAEMLGKGGFGTCYKAVLEDGSVVAVKRLKEVHINGGKKEFEQQMEVIGRLRHPNVVSLKAYYFATDEKLLVSDYIANASLFWLLHGNRGPGRTPLDWTTRLKIAAGAAQGVAFIHNNNNSKLTHGNIKSTNILVDVAGNAHVADFGLFIFATRSNGRKSNGYRAPEISSDGRKQTQKSDVYSFGVLLMEILTGKCPADVDGGEDGGASVDLPRWVLSVVREQWTAEVFDLELMRYKDIEEEMVALLKIAMECTVAAPDQRPTMFHVVKMIEELRLGNASFHGTSDSVQLHNFHIS